MAIRVGLLAMFCAAGVAPAAQFDMTASQAGDRVILTFRPIQAADAITGRPYSATLTSERTLADGTRMIQPGRRVYRDSQGRTRTEELRPIGYADPFLVVEIVDPVAGYSYLLDSQNRVAHRLAVKVNSKPAVRAKVVCATESSANTGTMKDGSAMTTEPLAAQMVEGVSFCGSKTTSIYPPDSMFHNDRPVTVVNEMWTAWDDGLPFSLHKNSWPGGQSSVSWIKAVSLSEPDSALFRPGPEYSVVDESGTFAISLPRSSPVPGVRQVTALTEMPFSAEQDFERRRTDPGGATMTQEFSMFYYRDGRGRTASGRMAADSSGKQVFQPTNLTDPVAGYSYNFDHEGKIAHRRTVQVKFKPASEATLPAAEATKTDTMKNGVVSVFEWLGTQTIGGYETVGRRDTLRYPPGTMGGNDRAFVTSNEFWTSPVLGIALLAKMSHPEAGDSVATIRNLHLGEPDPAMFRVPDGYRVVDY
ncbi:MAG TPA: hypothetical protein VMB03_32055 [Bryobacteraceae bacterium]|nr:hypothetical protein [Bryobacteraceae bacterium]